MTVVASKSTPLPKKYKRINHLTVIYYNFHIMNDNCLYAITITPISLTYVKIISTLSTKRVDSWIAGNRTEPADSSASDDSGPGPFSVFPFSLREEERTVEKGGLFLRPY